MSSISPYETILKSSTPKSVIVELKSRQFWSQNDMRALLRANNLPCDSRTFRLWRQKVLPVMKYWREIEELPFSNRHVWIVFKIAPMMAKLRIELAGASTCSIAARILCMPLAQDNINEACFRYEMNFGDVEEAETTESEVLAVA